MSTLCCRKASSCPICHMNVLCLPQTFRKIGRNVGEDHWCRQRINKDPKPSLVECQISLQWERTLGLCLKLFGFGLKGFEELDGAIANPVKCNFVLSRSWSVTSKTSERSTSWTAASWLLFILLTHCFAQDVSSLWEECLAINQVD